ncbi:MAG: hypothetical protein UX39_C0004G0028, partial [Candidatus Magasanikbacteria bacterium GW2011_GWA2_46_17]
VNTAYQYNVIAKNGNDVWAATSTSSTAKYTLAAQVGAPTVSAASTTSLTMALGVNGNPAATTYAIYNFTSGSYLNSAGAATGTPVWQTTSTWANATSTGLSANTAYQYNVIARNSDNTQAATSTSSTAKYTLAAQADAPPPAPRSGRPPPPGPTPPPPVSRSTPLTSTM